MTANIERIRGSRETDLFLRQDVLEDEERPEPTTAANVAFVAGIAFVLGSYVWYQNCIPLSSYHVILITGAAACATVAITLFKDPEVGVNVLSGGLIGLMAVTITSFVKSEGTC